MGTHWPRPQPSMASIAIAEGGFGFDTRCNSAFAAASVVSILELLCGET